VVEKWDGMRLSDGKGAQDQVRILILHIAWYFLKVGLLFRIY